MNTADAPRCAHTSGRLEQLGLALGEVDHAIDALEIAGQGGLDLRRSEFLEGMATALERLIPFQPVRSAGGALAQLAAVQAAALDLAATALMSGPPQERAQHDAELRISAALRAVALWIEQESGLDRERFGGGRAMSGENDPAPGARELLRAA